MEEIEQKIQDEDYSFPYHYVPQFKPGFTQTYTLTWGLYYISALEFVLKKVADCQPEVVADIGTGDGRLVREMSHVLPEIRTVGIDYSERAINLARALNPELEFINLDIISDSLDEKFDVITLVEVFEHIPLERARQFAASLPPLLNNNGRLLVTVPHENIPVIRKHFQHFSERTLRSYFEEYFDVEEVVFLDKSSRWVHFIRKILYNQYLILNHWGIKNRIYKLYKRRFLICNESDCGRIFMKLKKK